MILISGTSLGVKELPFSDIMEYTIESDPQRLAIKLKTVAKTSNCIGIYLSESVMKDMSMTDDLLNKTVLFSDDNHLLSLLDNGGKDETQESHHEEENDQQEIVFTEHKEEPIAVKKDAELSGSLVIEDVDTSLTDTLLLIPNIVDDIDNLHQQLDSKQRIIEQKDAIIMDLQKNLDDAYRLQEIQLLEMRDVYAKRVEEAESLLEEMKSKLESSSVPEELKSVLRYAPYIHNYRAFLKEGLPEEDLKRLSRYRQDVLIFASGSGDSLHSMLKSVAQLIETNKDIMLIDFSNDYYMIGHYKINTKNTSMLLNSNEYKVDQLVKDINGATLIPTSTYNDIALLGVDWASVLEKLFQHAKNKQIVLLFNNINSFSVRYTVSKLATIGKLFIFAKSNPVILSSLFGDLAFIPAERLKVVAMNYIDVVKPVLEQIAKRYNIHAFKDKIDWDKVGVK